MQYVAILTTSETTPLPVSAETDLARALSAQGAEVGDGHLLWPGLAVEIHIECRSPLKGAELNLPFPADINILPSAGRRKSLLIADMDSTIITSESLDDLARLSGKGDDVAAITARSIRGELDFSASLMERVRMIGGQPDHLIRQIINEVEYTPGAEVLLATMKAHGAHAILASGGFTFLTRIVAQKLGFDEHYANELIIRDGLITGEVALPILDQNAKATRLEVATRELGLRPDDVATIGDGANDRGMTMAAGLGVAYRGKPALKDVADACLDHADLRGLLWLQGYDKTEMVLP
ncbi:phosphoserine phosphatase SerB [Alphaproteobacteria bacterium LSUCC0684]